jgi:hypothetical protein
MLLLEPSCSPPLVGVSCRCSRGREDAHLNNPLCLQGSAAWLFPYITDRVAKTRARSTLSSALAEVGWKRLAAAIEGAATGGSPRQGRIVAASIVSREVRPCSGGAHKVWEAFLLAKEGGGSGCALSRRPPCLRRWPVGRSGVPANFTHLMIFQRLARQGAPGFTRTRRARGRRLKVVGSVPMGSPSTSTMTDAGPVAETVDTLR